MSMKLESTPTAIDHIKTVTTTGRCFAVSWTEDNQVLVVTRAGIDLRDADLDVTRNIVKDDNIIFWSAKLFGNKLVTALNSSSERSDKLYFGNLKDPTKAVLHTEGYDGQLVYMRHPSINKHYIVHNEMTSNTLKVFSSANETHLFDIRLKELEYPFCTLIADDTVLVTDAERGKLCKYNLSPSPDPIWTYDGLLEPSAIAVDESGFIYLAAFDTHTVHIICPEKG